MAKKKAKSKVKTMPKTKPKPKKVSWLAKGYPVLSSVTVLDNCAGAIDWYKKVLGARQRLRMDMPGGTVAHCELGFGDAVLMLGSPMPPQFPPKTACLGIYVKDCDAIFQKALSAGRALTPGADRQVLRRSQWPIRGSLRERMGRDDPHQGRQRKGNEEGHGPDGRRVTVDYRIEPGLDPADFIDVLVRSSLGERRPINRPDVIAAMLANADIVATARVDKRLVGISRAISDFAYCTYLSDLAVDEAYQGRGIGRELDPPHARSGGLADRPDPARRAEGADLLSAHRDETARLVLGHRPDSLKFTDALPPSPTRTLDAPGMSDSRKAGSCHASLPSVGTSRSGTA